MKGTCKVIRRKYKNLICFIFILSKNLQSRKKKSNETLRRSSRELVLIHDFDATRIQQQKKHQRNKSCLGVFGAEDEIRTRATVSHTTPLAGEPLEPLGYFCKAQLFKTL